MIRIFIFSWWNDTYFSFSFIFSWFSTCDIQVENCYKIIFYNEEIIFFKIDHFKLFWIFELCPKLSKVYHSHILNFFGVWLAFAIWRVNMVSSNSSIDPVIRAVATGFSSSDLKHCFIDSINEVRFIFLIRYIIWEDTYRFQAIERRLLQSPRNGVVSLRNVDV